MEGQGVSVSLIILQVLQLSNLYYSNAAALKKIGPFYLQSDIFEKTFIIVRQIFVLVTANPAVI